MRRIILVIGEYRTFKEFVRTNAAKAQQFSDLSMRVEVEADRLSIGNSQYIFVNKMERLYGWDRNNTTWMVLGNADLEMVEFAKQKYTAEPRLPQMYNRSGLPYETGIDLASEDFALSQHPNCRTSIEAEWVGRKTDPEPQSIGDILKTVAKRMEPTVTKDQVYNTYERTMTTEQRATLLKQMTTFPIGIDTTAFESALQDSVRRVSNEILYGVKKASPKSSWLNHSIS